MSKYQPYRCPECGALYLHTTSGRYLCSKNPFDHPAGTTWDPSVAGVRLGEEDWSYRGKNDPDCRQFFGSLFSEESKS